MKEDLKTITLAVVGTGASFGLAQVSLVLSIVASALTITFLTCRLIDWFEARAEKRRLKED